MLTGHSLVASDRWPVVSGQYKHKREIEVKENSGYTAYKDVNAALLNFQERIQAILGSQFVGMYLYGSLALGDFDPGTSDIDFIVVTQNEITDADYAPLAEMHEQFDQSGSTWAKRIEAAYIPQQALYQPSPTSEKYPQVEKGTKLFKAPLENGWCFQLHTLRTYGVVVAGPDPQDITGLVDLSSMRQAVLAIAGGWLEQSRKDPEWLEWVRLKEAQSFVVLTLCRMLYSLETGDVASKPAAARWAKQFLDQDWADLVDRALSGQHAFGEASSRDVEDTLALIRYTAEQCQND
jgi:hypothetical protein